MKNEKTDARKLSPEVLEEKRIMAIKLREKGIKNSEVSKIVGLSQQTISTHYNKYKKEGIGILKSVKRGRRKGEGKKLSDEQEQKIIKLLIDKNPKQLQFKFALWTREAVKQLIYRELDIELPISTVGEYLKPG